MTNPIAEFNREIEGTPVAVLGVGVSNLPLIRFLVKKGALVTAHDKSTPEEMGETYAELKSLGVKTVTGKGYLDKIGDDVKMIFKTPGIRYDVPAILAAMRRGAKLTSEMELFFELCPANIIGVTGSDGKTTTTALINDMLTRGGYKCYLGGNIGKPLIDEVENIRPSNIAVVELSSFQLHTMERSPHIAVITNVTPNHLDWHKDFEEYANAKRALFKFQKAGDRAVFNYDNQVTRGFSEEAPGSLCFSRREILRDGYCLAGDNIVLRKNGETVREILNIKDIYIPGMHNVENYMAAIGAIDGMVDDEVIGATAGNFKGVPHRIEFVRELDGVKYYNDSIASSPARTTAGLNSFNQKVILIAGGYDKKIPFDEFGVVVADHVKELILCGHTSDDIEKAVRKAKNFDGMPIYKIDDFEKAILKAKEAAKPGDVVILSPACASFDMFKNFEERGNKFKETVNNL